MNIKDLGYESSWAAVTGFWGGWVGAGALIAGGKLWTLMTDPQLKVSTLLGHIGTPSFRRQLAVGAAVSCVAFVIFEYVYSKNQMEKNNLTGRIRTYSSTAAACALGSFAGASVTHAGYKLVLYSICGLTVTLLLSDFYRHYNAQNLCNLCSDAQNP
jgi:hypothetical protein